MDVATLRLVKGFDTTMPQTLRLDVTPATLALLRELTDNAVLDAGLELERQSSLSSFGANRRLRSAHLDSLRASLAVAQELVDARLDAEADWNA